LATYKEGDQLKPGLEIGTKATKEITVTPEMFAQFDGVVVHPAYSTVAMVYHMEWVSRLIILPFLEQDEEGMGGAVTVKHLAPSPEGALLTVTAELIKFNGNILLTQTEVKHGEQLVGIGEVKQVIVPIEKINNLLKR
jgi:fluoroacetyl-CoA thioesterase